MLGNIAQQSKLIKKLLDLLKNSFKWETAASLKDAVSDPQRAKETNRYADSTEYSAK